MATRRFKSIKELAVKGGDLATAFFKGGQLKFRGIQAGSGMQVTKSGDDLVLTSTGGAPEGTAVLSTGETGGGKFLRENGDGTCSWVAIPGGGDLLSTNNLSDVANAATARTNLGLAIGSDVQAHSAVLDATTASFLTADETKLDGIESGAEVNAVDSVNALTGAVVLDPDDLDDTATAHKFASAAELSKLAGIETAATADQTDAEIRAAVAAATDSNVFTDADHSKLDGIEAAADVTDTANVTAAGAVMDSEVDADIKTLALPANTTISAFGASVVDDADAAAARSTLGLVIGTDVLPELALVSQAEAEAGTATTERIWSALRVAQAIAALGGGGGSVSQVSTDILVGTASATGNNIHGAKGTVVAISWDASTNDSSEVTSFTNGDTDIQITNAGQIRIYASIACIDAGLNNRSTYLMHVRHLNSSDVEQYLYYFDDTYVRDDSSTYDSGLMSAALEINVAAGDKIQIRSEVLDVQTTTGTVNASTTYSKIKVEKLTYS